MTEKTARAVLALVLLLLCGCRSSDQHLPADAPGHHAPSQIAVSKPTEPVLIPEFEIPPSWESPDGSVLPVNYLEQLSVDVARVLTAAERRQLAALITKAHEDSLRLYGQSYYLSAASAIGQLIRSNFPDVPVHEGGALLYLGEVAAHMEGRVASEP